MDADADLGAACAEVGPIDGETEWLVELALGAVDDADRAVVSSLAPTTPPT